VAAEDHPIGVLPADPRYVGHRLTDPSGAGIMFELRDLSGRVVGRARLPRGMRQSVATGDGYGITGIRSDNGSSVRVATIAGGPVRILMANSGHWAEGWTADGAAVIADRQVGEGLVVDALPLSGGERRQATLPAGALGSGWQTSLGPWFSYQTRTPDALHAINLATGQTHPITRALEARIGVQGRGGQAQDGSRWVYPERTRAGIDFRSVDPATGASESIRAFPDGRGQRNDFMIHGTRLAWFEVRGDSVDLLLSDGPSSPVRRLASFHTSEVGDEERDAWSWKGDRIAVCTSRSGPVRANLLSTFTIPAGNAMPMRQDYEIGTASGCWAPQWLPDDSGVVFLAVMDRRDNVPDLMHFALREGTRPAVLTGDDPNEIWSFTLSPDGRFAAYTVSLPATNSSVHVASFKAAIEGR
jgi:hypothetical protein